MIGLRSGEHRISRTLAALLFLGSASLEVGESLSHQAKADLTNQMPVPASSDPTYIACGKTTSQQKLAYPEKVDSDGAWRPVVLQFNPKNHNFQFADVIPASDQEPMVTAQRDAVTIANQLFPEAFDSQKYMRAHTMEAHLKAGLALSTYCVQVVANT
jgi:hypothetical protein